MWYLLIETDLNYLNDESSMATQRDAMLRKRPPPFIFQGLEKIMCLFYRIYIEVIHRFYALIQFLTVSEYEYIHDG